MQQHTSKSGVKMGGKQRSMISNSHKKYREQELKNRTAVTTRAS